MYVSTSGDDTTGDGTQANPWATIQKALKVCPQANGYYIYTINVAGGSYAGFTVDNQNIYFSLQGVVTISSQVVITNSFVKFSSNALNVIANVSGGNFSAFAVFASTVYFNYINVKIVNTTTSTTAGRALYVEQGANVIWLYFAAGSSLTLSAKHHGAFVQAGGNLSAWTINITKDWDGATNPGVGLFASFGGVISYGSLTGAWGTPYSGEAGGRVYAGGQASIPSY